MAVNALPARPTARVPGPVGGAGGYYAPAPAAYPNALLGRDNFQAAAPPAAYGAQAGQMQIAGVNTSFLGWAGGLAVGAFWALPKLAKFGPAGFFTSAIVILGCGFYGSRAVGAAQGLLGGSIQPAAEVGAWFVGAKLAAGMIGGMRNPGALVAAFLIWLGSWAAGKVLNAVWPR